MRSTFITAAALAASVLAAKSPSTPEEGQFSRYRGAKRGELISMVPVDGAEFLAGQRFDVSVELHNVGSNSSFPDVSGIKVTVNGQPIEQVVGKKLERADTWSFSYNTDMRAAQTGVATPVAVSRVAVRSGAFAKPGTYTVVATVGAVSTTNTWVVRSPKKRMVKNLVLFIGDGMAPTAIAAARVLSRDTTFGKFGDNILDMERLGSVGKIITNGIDAIITDSANSAAAYLSGQKGWSGTLNVYKDTSADTTDDPKTETLAEIIREARPNMCIGIVTTAEVNDATPASVYSHTAARGDSAKIVDQSINGFSHANITWDPKAVRPDFMAGGGGRVFCANNSTFCLQKSSYYDAYAALGYTVVKSKTELEAQQNGNKPLIGIFSSKHMDTWLDRTLYPDNLKLSASDPSGSGRSNTDQPGLELMTMTAIKTLAANPKCSDGFFLMSEAASVDKALHATDYDRAIADLLELDRTVKATRAWAEKEGSTAIIVTADHSQAFDTYGTVDTGYLNTLTDTDALQVQQRLALGVYDQAGWPTSVVDETTGVPTNWKGNTRLLCGKVDSLQHRENFQLKTPVNATNPLTRASVKSVKVVIPGTVPTNQTVYVQSDSEPVGLSFNPTLPPSEGSTVHSLQSVDLFCYGPDAFKASCAKVMDNTNLFFIMADALGLGLGDVVPAPGGYGGNGAAVTQTVTQTVTVLATATVAGGIYVAAPTYASSGAVAGSSPAGSSPAGSASPVATYGAHGVLSGALGRSLSLVFVLPIVWMAL